MGTTAVHSDHDITQGDPAGLARARPEFKRAAGLAWNWRGPDQDGTRRRKARDAHSGGGAGDPEALSVEEVMKNIGMIVAVSRPKPAAHDTERQKSEFGDTRQKGCIRKNPG